jgi:hypothetical protein
LKHVSWEQWRDPNAKNPKQKTQDRDNHLTDVFGLMEGSHPMYIKQQYGEAIDQRWPEFGVA